MNCTMRLCLAGHAACAIGQRGSVRLIFFLCLLDGLAQGPQVPSIYNISMVNTVYRIQLTVEISGGNVLIY